jgi:rare lipoprotein A
VSKLAAERLGFLEKGTTRVRVDILADESKELKEAMLAGDIMAQTAYTSEGKTPRKKQPVRSMTAPKRPVGVYADNGEEEQENMPIRSITNTPVIVSDEMDDAAANPEEKIVSSPSSPLFGSADKALADETAAAGSSGSGLYVQVGAFSNRQNAEKFASTLAEYGNTKISTTKINGADIYRVRMGVFATGKDALEALDKMRALGYNDARIVEEVVLTKEW